MKIFHVVDSMEMGGAERLVSAMCRMQRDRGHQASVHCLLRIGVLGQELRRDGFDVQLHGPAHLPRATRRFFRLFRAERPDAVHCHNPTAAIYAAAPARLAGVPKIVATRHSLVAPPYDRLREIKFSVAARFCDSVVGVCGATVENLSHAPLARRDNLVRIYNGATPIGCGQDGPARRGFTLLHAGRLVPVKNQSVLLEALALVRETSPDVFLWLVGGGALRSELQRLTEDLGISNAVTFFGEQTDVSPFFRTADAFIMCSRSEGLPLALLEAMSAGLPAIVTNVGGMAEVVSLSRGGIVAPATGPQALAGAIRVLASDKTLVAQYGSAARRCFERTFSMSAMVDEYMRLYTC